MKSLLIDADIIAYRIGFTALKSSWGEQLAVSTFHNTITEICDTLNGTPSLYFTGRGPRYREQFANEIPYKQSREGKERPLFLPEMTEYAFNAFPCCVSNSQWGEADDLIACAAYKCASFDEYVVVTIDKDLNMIPGNHYNPVKKESFFMSKEDAYMFFFKQLLAGDKTDDIPGIKGIGLTRASKILKGCSDSPEKAFDRVLDTYSNHYSDLSEDEIATMIYNRANLLWLRRTHEEVWTPPIPE